MGFIYSYSSGWHCNHRAKEETQKDTNKFHDDVIKWKHFPCYWPFVRGINRSPMNSPHKGQWRGSLMFSLSCVLINGWVNNRRFETLSHPLWRHRHALIPCHEQLQQGSNRIFILGYSTPTNCQNSTITLLESRKTQEILIIFPVRMDSTPLNSPAKETSWNFSDNITDFKTDRTHWNSTLSGHYSF